MKFNKNIFAFAIYLAMSSPVTSQDNEETIAQDISQEITEQAVTRIESDLTEEFVATTQAPVQHEISDEEAYYIIKSFAETIVDGNTFTVHNRSFVLETTRALSPAQQAIITSILSDILNSAVATIADEIAEYQHNPISQHDALVLLQTFANSLVPGSSFELNDVSYTVTSASNKTSETATEPRIITLEQAQEIFNSPEAVEFLATKNLTADEAYNCMTNLLAQIQNQTIEIDGNRVPVEGVSFTINDTAYIVKSSEVVASQDFDAEDAIMEEIIAEEQEEAFIEAVEEYQEEVASEEAMIEANEELQNTDDIIIESDDSEDVIIETYAGSNGNEDSDINS